MRLRSTVVCAGLVGFASVAAAANVEVVVRADGQPVADAVVSARPLGADALTAPTPTTHSIDQRDETFVPYVQIFRPGDSVVFHNSDKTRHHVYSFSPAKPFEFVLAQGEVSPALALDRDGVIAVGCNIHDQMIAHLYVSDAAYLAQTDASGRAVLNDLAEGEYEVSLWHPRQRPGTPALQQTVEVAGSATKPIAFSLTLVPDRRSVSDREKAKY
jgi:plastocyanin